MGLAFVLGLVSMPYATALAQQDATPSGPVLQLEGLPQEHAGDASAAPASHDATQAHDAAHEITTKERFEKRLDKTTTLTERARAIVNRTTIGGYGEHAFVTGNGEVSRFINNRYVVFVYSNITDRISTATEIEFEFGGSPMKKGGVLGVGEALLEFSVVDFRVMDWLVMRAGIVLVPMGSLNLRHDSPTQDLTDRPIAYTTIVPSTWFESGAGFYGTVPIGEVQRITYEVYVVNGLDSRIADGTGFRGARGSHFEDNNQDKAVVGRLAWSPQLGLELGASGYTGAYDKSKNRANMVNLDLTWRQGAFELLAEAVYAHLDAGYVQGFDASSPANTRDAVPTDMLGFYVQGNYHFQIPFLWRMLPDDLQQGTFTAVARYEGKDTDMHHVTAVGDARRLTIGLNYRPTEPYVLKTDFQFNTVGVNGGARAAELWDGRFWTGATFRFLTSVAFLF